MQSFKLKIEQFIDSEEQKFYAKISAYNKIQNVNKTFDKLCR